MWLKSACSVIIPASTDLASIPDYAPAGSGSHRTAAGSNQTSRGDAAGRVTAEGSAAGQNRLDRCPSNLIVAARACKLHERDAGAREYRPRSVPREPLGEFPSALNAPAPHHDRVWWPGCRVAWIDRHRPRQGSLSTGPYGQRFSSTPGRLLLDPSAVSSGVVRPRPLAAPASQSSPRVMLDMVP